MWGAHMLIYRPSTKTAQSPRQRVDTTLTPPFLVQARKVPPLWQNPRDQAPSPTQNKENILRFGSGRYYGLRNSDVGNIHEQCFNGKWKVFLGGEGVVFFFVFFSPACWYELTLIQFRELAVEKKPGSAGNRQESTCFFFFLIIK